MASSTKASAASEHSSVQPSALLIEALHHKLCDPSIVPQFEQCRSPHVTQRLITPRWILKDSAAEKLAGAYSKAVGGSSTNKNESDPKSDTNNDHDNNGNETNNNNEPKFNTRPKRTYLDIRKQQNTTFANEQHLRCQKKLAALSSTSPKSVEAINVNKLQIKKVIDSIQNHLNEGLAACPNHEGLVQVELEVRGWLDRLNGVVVVGNGFNNGLASAVVDTANVAMAGTEEVAKNNNAIIDLTQTSPQQTVVKRKGGEGRAQAAMDDALVEKMFLQGETDNGNGGDSKNNDDAVDTNQLKWVPPASRVDESADQHMRRRKEGASDSDSYHGRKRSRHSHRRRSSRYQSKSRSRSRSAEREDRRKGERRHRYRRREDDRKRKKHLHRSRSRSLSRGSVSSAAASLASRSTSRDRSSKRRHRKDRHSRHKRRYKSKSRRKERRKSSRRHRSRRERSRSVSSSSCPSTAGADGIKGRFEPPQLAQQVQKETEEGRPVQREDMDGMEGMDDLEPQSNDNGALGEIMQSGD